MFEKWVEYINAQVAGANAVLQVAEKGDSSIKIEAQSLFKVCETLKNGEYEFQVLQLITGTDYPETGELEISYILASFTKNLELILKVRVPRGTDDNLPKLDSLTSLWSAAFFQERECFDMIGVDFVGHKNLRRVLCPYDWTGHPLRKDYVVQETYAGMTVNPVNKMNIEEREFGARHKLEKGSMTSVENYKIDVPETAPTSQETTEA